jgi:hypothetical protein
LRADEDWSNMRPMNSERWGAISCNLQAMGFQSAPAPLASRAATLNFDDEYEFVAWKYVLPVMITHPQVLFLEGQREGLTTRRFWQDTDLSQHRSKLVLVNRS